MRGGIGLIGFGAMARKVVAVLAAVTPPPRLAGILESGAGLERARQTLGDAAPVTDLLADLLAWKPAAVAECATAAALRAHGPAVLAAGIDLVAISIGALADPGTLDALRVAAAEGGSRLIIPAGALGGIDALAAARLGGLTAVRQTLSKPPRAWKGTPAERALDLDALREPVAFFRGSAREAATLYPLNANVAAVVALAGLGFDRSTVTLVADPGLPGPVHRVEAEGGFGAFTIEVRGVALPDNPKSSTLAALSVARALINGGAAIVV